VSRTWWPAILCLTAAPAAAQQIATSPGPSAVSVTVYRAPGRSAAEAINLRWLNGYALITETRAVTIPAGEADIRFEGVAGGIQPESAIVTGLPDGVAEKNQDAYLLSPASLLDRSLGARVHLRRTSRATGRVREEDAVVRTGADGGIVVETAAGIEALRCTGLPEAIVYDRVPPGLSAKPTLSVRTQSRRRTRATLTLSYLASGFDWQANYVGTLSPDGRAMDLFAWVTLANGDETSFARANTQAVAGRLSRRDAARTPRSGRASIALRCFPLGTTSDIPLIEFERMVDEEEDEGYDIVVTGSRVFAPPPEPVMMAPPPVVAQQEELGDLKLYRIPEPVTVAAMSQKQVVLLDKPRVAVAAVFRRRIYGQPDAAPVPTPRVFVTRNRIVDGLGVPLPAGPIAVFVEAGGRPLLIGQSAIDDRAVDEDVEITLSPAPGVLSQLTRHTLADNGVEYRLTVTNDGSAAAKFEAEFEGEIIGTGSDAGTRLERRLGRPLWRVSVPANGRAALRYRQTR